MKVSYTNFTGGEVTHSLASRYDLAKFKSSCRHLENFLPELHGPLSRRPGTVFLEDLGGPAVLLPFQFSADPTQNYAVILQDRKIRIAQENGFVYSGASPVTVETPYRESELYDISFAQSGDLVYLAHPGHQLRKLVREGHSAWKLEKVTLIPPIEPPSGDVTVAFTGSVGDYELRYKICSVSEKGELSRAAKGKQPEGKHPSDWVVGDHATITWQKAPDAVYYNIYREEVGIYGLVGTVTAADQEGNTVEFIDNGITADTKDTPPEPQDPFEGARTDIAEADKNNPGLVCFHQQRLILAAPRLRPQTWHASRTGSYEDFAKSKPMKDDDALEFTLASGRIDVIQWVAAFGDLLLGSAGAEYKATGSKDVTITPTSISVREQSYWGSARLRPLIIGNSVLHVQRLGSRVRDLMYSLERDGYAGNDLSVLAPHLFDGYFLRQWDYQQTPGSRIHAVRSDGMLLALTYLKEHEVWGWSRITTQGAFTSVTVTAGDKEDTVFAVVRRTINGSERHYLERFAPTWREEDGIENAFFVDCGLTYTAPGNPVTTITGYTHLEGCEVAVLADGSPVSGIRVENAAITLPFKAKVVHVGLPYSSWVCPQTPEADAQDGATLGRVRSYASSRIRLASSVGGSYGPDRETRYDLPYTPTTYGKPIVPFTGDFVFNPDAGYSAEGELWLSQNLPLPFTMVALILEVDIGG